MSGHVPPAVIWAAREDRQMLTSDADRDRAADALGAACAEGRLNAAEHGERVRAAYAARTWQQLGSPSADLPARCRGHDPGSATWDGHLPAVVPAVRDAGHLPASRDRLAGVVVAHWSGCRAQPLAGTLRAGQDPRSGDEAAGWVAGTR